MCPFWKAPRHSKTTESGVNLDFLKHTKEGFTLGIWRIHPAHKKIMTKDSSHGMCFFFWVLVVEDSDFYTFARVLVKSWTWERNWSRGVPEKRDTMVDPAKKITARQSVEFSEFFLPPFFLKMYSSFVPSCLRFWWMGWWGGSLGKAWMRISQQWDF